MYHYHSMWWQMKERMITIILILSIVATLIGGCAPSGQKVYIATVRATMQAMTEDASPTADSGYDVKTIRVCQPGEVREGETKKSIEVCNLQGTRFKKVMDCPGGTELGGTYEYYLCK